jgi:uncharacterized repeat protein (TIGR01451 family)
VSNHSKVHVVGALAAAVAALALVGSAAAKPDRADLSVSLTGSPSTVTAGGQVTYTATVTNNGPDTATNVTLRDWLVAGKGSVVSAAGGQGSCAMAKPFVLCSLGTLTNGQSTTVTIVVTANKPGLTIDHARVRSDQRDPKPRNNDAGVKTLVSFAANLSLALTGAPSSIKVGAQVTYTATVTNNGPDTATNVTLRDWLVVGKGSLVSATSGQGSCASAKPLVLCSLGTLTKGQSTTVTIVVTASKAGLMVDHARVRADQRDLHPRNNMAAVRTHVTK